MSHALFPEKQILQTASLAWKKYRSPLAAQSHPPQTQPAQVLAASHGLPADLLPVPQPLLLFAHSDFYNKKTAPRTVADIQIRFFRVLLH